MTSVKEIIKSVRYILVDSPVSEEARGWSDERLLDLIDEAQKEICKESRIFKKTHYLSMAYGQYSYKLPDDFVSADRFATFEARIPQLSMTDLDELATDWRARFSDQIEAIIKDGVDMNRLEVYPKRDDALVFIPFYTVAYIGGGYYLVLQRPKGVFSGLDTDVGLLNPNTGVLTSTTGALGVDLSDYEFAITYWGTITDVIGLNNLSTAYPDSPKGVLSDVNTRITADNVTWGAITDVAQLYGDIGGTWGVVCSLAKSNAVVNIRYSAIPQTLLYLDSLISIPDKWVTAIKYYASGLALLDDNDAKNNQKGIVFTQKAVAEIARLIKLGNSTDGSRSATRYNSLTKGKTINTEDY